MPRKSDYTPEMADLICERLANGESINAMCKDDDMPSQATVFNWLSQHPLFLEKYTRAREAQADRLFDEILEIADSQEADVITKDGQDFINHDVIARAKLRVDTRKWMAGKLRPKVYGDKVTSVVAGDPDNPLQTVTRIELVAGVK